MKRFNQIILVLIFFPFKSFGQPHFLIDSLHQQLRNSKTDSAKIWAMHDLSYNFLFSNPDSSLLYAQNGLDLSKKTSNIRGEIRCLNDVGNALQSIGNFSAALQTLFIGLQKAEESSDMQMLATCNGNIAAVYLTQGDYSHANYYTFACLKIDIANNDTLYQILDYSNLSNAYYKNNQSDSALLYINKAYELTVKFRDTNLLGVIFGNLANIHSKLGNDEIALSYYRKSIMLISNLNSNLNYLCDDYQGIAELFKRAGNKDSSIYYLRNAFTIAQNISLPTSILKSATMLASIYEPVNSDSTLKYLKMSVAIKDSIYNQEKIKQIQNLTFIEQSRQQEISLKVVNEQKVRKLNIQYAAIALTIILFVTLFLLLSRRIITNTRLIEFLGVVSLLIVFEFLNLLLHPFLERITDHSPVLMLLALVFIAALLVPMHHKIEKWATAKLVEKNKQIRLAAARKTIQLLDTKADDKLD